MGLEKEILTPSAALRRVEGLEKILDDAGNKGASPKTSEVKPKWKFVKCFGVANTLRFRDGSRFQFRLIKRNDGSGYESSSFVATDDEKLANNLREAAKNPATGVVEEKI